MDTGGDRECWLKWLDQLARPVLSALSAGRLRQVMQASAEATPMPASPTAALEAVGRLLTGIAPWLASNAGNADEQALRRQYREWCTAAIEIGCDPDSSDYLMPGDRRQFLVDAAFLAHAIVRAPGPLWEDLSPRARSRLANMLTRTRDYRPGNNNWLLFSALIELAMLRVGLWHDPVRIDYAFRQHLQWYKGDGIYGDGPELHFDYYNSYVIHPMMLAITDLVGDRYSTDEVERVRRRSARFGQIQERTIMPDGTFPAVGRSITYRAGAFHLLADLALRRALPPPLTPPQVRGALTAVQRRTLDVPGTFDAHGILTIGLAGHQPQMAESYICLGSLYLCAAALLPLGLPPDDPFWAASAEPWTQQRVWSGHDEPGDHSHREA